MDGPISGIRNRDLEIDKIIYQFNSYFVDGTIFQSNWSRQENYKLGLKKNKFETTITNAPDNKIFNIKGKIRFSPKRKTKLIATSWSNNWRKGFKIYKYLDENLDFNKYEMTFIGNSPISFENIKWIKPLPGEKIAKKLKQHDIFITASQKDPCSNSLIEALHCGLPAIALNDGGHPEIIKKGGELFNGKSDIIQKIDRIAKNYSSYQKFISLLLIQEVTQKYLHFTRTIFRQKQSGQYISKKASFINYQLIKIMTTYWQIKNKFV